MMAQPRSSNYWFDMEIKATKELMFHGGNRCSSLEITDIVPVYKCVEAQVTV